MKRCILLVTAVFFFGCGGGGGGNGGSGNTPPPIVGQVTCPNGSRVQAVSACPAVTAIPASYLNVDPRKLKDGIVVQFNGALDPKSVTDRNVVLNGGAVGTIISGTVTLATGNMDLFYIPKQWLAYGQSYALTINVSDSVTRPVQLTVPVTTIPMSCTNIAFWSTPAVFSPVYQNCVSGIGVQAKASSFNTMQDNTCTPTIGTPLSSACRGYMANGTILLANTGVIANGMWMFFIGTNKSNNLILLDVTNPFSPVPVATLVLSSPLEWIIGNPTGAFIHTANGRGSQVTVGPNQTLVSTCILSCS